MRDYEHMKVSVCEWVPGQEFSAPRAGSEVNAKYSPEESELMAKSNITGYAAGDCGTPYTKEPIQPGNFQWYEGANDDWLCGRTDRDLYYGYGQTFELSFI